MGPQSGNIRAWVPVIEYLGRLNYTDLHSGCCNGLLKNRGQNTKTGMSEKTLKMASGKYSLSEIIWEQQTEQTAGWK